MPNTLDTARQADRSLAYHHSRLKAKGTCLACYHDMMAIASEQPHTCRVVDDRQRQIGEMMDVHVMD